MNKITQTMRFRQAVIEYSLKHGVTKAAIRYRLNRQYIYRWRRRYANAQGGKIYIGCDDDGNVVGLSNARKLLEDIPNKIRDAKLGLFKNEFVSEV